MVYQWHCKNEKLFLQCDAAKRIMLFSLIRIQKTIQNWQSRELALNFCDGHVSKRCVRIFHDVSDAIGSLNLLFLNLIKFNIFLLLFRWPFQVMKLVRSMKLRAPAFCFVRSNRLRKYSSKSLELRSDRVRRFLVVEMMIFRRESWLCIVTRGLTARVCASNVRLCSTESSYVRYKYFLLSKFCSQFVLIWWFFELFCVEMYIAYVVRYFWKFSKKNVSKTIIMCSAHIFRFWFCFHWHFKTECGFEMRKRTNCYLSSC